MGRRAMLALALLGAIWPAGAGSMQMVSPKDALPGREVAMEVSDKHYVLQNQMKGPWPPGEIHISGALSKGMEKFVFANGLLGFMGLLGSAGRFMLKLKRLTAKQAHLKQIPPAPH